MSFIIQTFFRIRRFSYFIGENKTKTITHGRLMSNQLKKVLCTDVSFQESRDLMKEEPETNVYDMFLSYWSRFKAVLI